MIIKKRFYANKYLPAEDVVNIENFRMDRADWEVLGYVDIVIDTDTLKGAPTKKEKLANLINQAEMLEAAHLEEMAEMGAKIDAIGDSDE